MGPPVQHGCASRVLVWNHLVMTPHWLGQLALCGIAISKSLCGLFLLRHTCSHRHTQTNQCRQAQLCRFCVNQCMLLLDLFLFRIAGEKNITVWIKCHSFTKKADVLELFVPCFKSSDIFFLSLLTFFIKVWVLFFMLVRFLWLWLHFSPLRRSSRPRKCFNYQSDPLIRSWERIEKKYMKSASQVPKLQLACVIILSVRGIRQVASPSD